MIDANRFARVKVIRDTSVEGQSVAVVHWKPMSSGENNQPNEQNENRAMAEIEMVVEGFGDIVPWARMTFFGPEEVNDGNDASSGVGDPKRDDLSGEIDSSTSVSE